MRSSVLLKSFFKISYADFKQHQALFNRAFVVLVILNILDAFPWELMGLGQNSAPEIILNLIMGIIGVVITVDVINSQVAIVRNRQKERLLYTVFGFFIIQILYLIMSVLGFTLFIIPGLMAFVLFGLAPLIRIVEPDASVFKRSFHLVKKDVITAAALIFGSLLLEFVPAGVALIPGWQLRGIILIALSYPLALISFLFIQSLVKFYFFVAVKE